MLTVNEAQTLSGMQAPFFGERGILPALPRALYLESGKLDESGLSFINHRAAAFDDFVLVVFLSRVYFQIDFRVQRIGCINV